MAEKLWMLALSPTMEKGVITRWLKQEGDSVTSGDVLCEVETDKAVMDYESPATGVVLKLVLPEGTSASVGDLIAIVGKPGEDISALVSGGASAVVSKPEQAKQKEPIKIEAVAEAVTDSSPDANSAPAESSSGFIRSTPLARKLAELNGLSLASMVGSGPLGRIIKADVEKAMTALKPAAAAAGALIKVGEPIPASADVGIARAGQPVPAESAPVAIPPVQSPQDVVIPISSKRRIIAQRLSESMFTAPHYYLKLRVEMDELLKSRERINARSDVKVSINALLIKFAAEALKRHPMIHASWHGDTIVQHGRIDIGLAVAQKDGLITPVVRDCGNKGLIEIEQSLKDLVQRARDNALKPEEYTGASFTISSLGSFGIEEFTAIINPPGSAILAVGEIRKEPVVQPDDSIKVRSVMRLTLSCDHRVIDGSVGASFLSDLRSMMEDPVRALL